jgi:hypothetical protein
MPYRTKKSGKSDYLTPFRPIASHTIKLPGFDGPRPSLSFVLKVLAGDAEVIDGYLSRLICFSDADVLEHMREDRVSIELAQASMVSTMRELANLWIDSGKSRSDSKIDTPAARNVEDILPGHSISLFKLIQFGLLNDHPSWTVMRRDGTQGIKTRPPRFDATNVQNLGWDHAMHFYGKRLALYEFMRLLGLKYSRHFSRCDKCDRYFAYKRAPKRTLKNGVFCDACQGAASVSRTQEVRNRRTQRLVEFAADIWAQWKPTPQHGKQSRWVAGKVNQRLKDPRRYITGRWVTQHQAEIEAELNRRNSAVQKT